MAYEILECSVETFLEHYAPFKPSTDSIEVACQKLKHQDFLVPSTQLKRGNDTLTRVQGLNDGFVWERLGGHTHFEMINTKQRIFKIVEEAVEILVEPSPETGDCIEGRLPSYQYKYCPDGKIVGETGGTTFPLDACFVPNNSVPAESTTINAWEAAVIAEFKREEQSEIENQRKLVSAASFIMNDDPRRMWMYGDYRTLIRVLLSFLCAEPEKMGFDPTVHRMSLADKTQYVYQVGPKNDPQFYRTTRAIFNPDDPSITGRKTRVWEAIRVAGCHPGEYSHALDDEHKYAIKDVWLNEGTHTEREKLDNIFKQLAEISKSPPNHEWYSPTLQAVVTEALRDENYKRYFINIIVDSKGFSCRAKPRGVKHNLKILRELQEELTSMDSRSNRQGFVKQQYRLVYGDVGDSLHDSRDFSTAFHAIQDVFIALVLLFLANWVHCDVSTGNIIVIQKNGKVSGKLSDLEYAKEFCSGPALAKELKVGTPFFMPYEIHSGQRIVYERLVVPNGYDFPDDPSAQVSPFADADQSQEEMLFFRFSYDLESLWWIMLWFFLTRVNYSPAYNLARRVFTHNIKPSKTRGAVFKTRSGKSVISEAIPPEFKDVYPWVEYIRIQLLSSHTESSLNSQDYAILYGTYWKNLCRVVIGVESLKDILFIDQENTDTVPASMTAGEERTTHWMVSRKRKASEVDHPSRLRLRHLS
ncbi:hypothetical protein D9756_001077 [Leucocoprinus leucothites]|uniref:Fungal-type protein kinase domain-containing protein n=1 Tax=Leucocoprinus leucothites TaxID=201217 RepID=A0A8H5GE78_9AGAR|nr:hypothetical protein D9756_001077 [Leucoagaricus leucothites]